MIYPSRRRWYAINRRRECCGDGGACRDDIDIEVHSQSEREGADRSNGRTRTNVRGHKEEEEMIIQIESDSAKLFRNQVHALMSWFRWPEWYLLPWEEILMDTRQKNPKGYQHWIAPRTLERMPGFRITEQRWIQLEEGSNKIMMWMDNDYMYVAEAR